MLNTHVFSPSSQLDKDLFELMLLDAATNSTPTYIADVETDPANFERYCAEGRMRAEANARMKGNAWRREDQLTPGQDLTVDELGRVGEGAIEEMLGLDVAPVLADSTDRRPDKTLAGVKFDVKTATPRPGDSFAVPCYKVKNGGYDALLLVQHLEPGLARVWCCKCKPEGLAWMKLGGARGKTAFWRIACSPESQA